MMILVKVVLIVAVCTGLAAHFAQGAESGTQRSRRFSQGELETLRDGFETRREAMLKTLAGKPFKAAPKRPPLAPGRPEYVRGYTYSVTDFAMKSFWLDEQQQAANAALLEMARYFIENKPARDDSDNFYWSADVVCRIVEFFGRGGSRAAGRLSGEVEDALREMMWVWSKDHSAVADADVATSRTWFVWGSENHHIQRFSACWHFAKLLKDDGRFGHRPYEDGKTAAEHYAAWTDYAKEYLRERAKKSLFVEIANGGYGFETLKGIYNFYDFADDGLLRKRAGYLIDLYWATWAEEQLDAVRGGGKARIYPWGSSSRGADHLTLMAWYYMNVGQGAVPRANEFTPVTSGYRLPLVVMDLALDVQGRGIYETRQFPLGAAMEGFDNTPAYRLRTDAGGIYRYSYCTPDFILGTTMFPALPAEAWTAISSQNRWHGAIFAGHRDARIFPQCRAVSRNRAYNQHWSVQAKGTLIAQKLKGSRGAAEMRVWFSRPGLTNRVERDGWVFVEAPGAYAAVRPVAGGYQWQADETDKTGQWLACLDEWTPVILDVAAKSGFADYAAFQDRVLANPLTFQKQVLEYKGLGGQTLTFYADYSQPPKIDGQPVRYTPDKAFDSPFVQGEWNGGVITIRKGDRTLVLDFNRQD